MGMYLLLFTRGFYLSFFFTSKLKGKFDLIEMIFALILSVDAIPSFLCNFHFTGDLGSLQFYFDLKKNQHILK